MTDSQTEASYLDLFPQWLQALGGDSRALLEILRDGDAPEGARRYAASALNYVFKSLDLIPDGIDDLGFLDDAFVVRVACALANEESPFGAETAPGRLAHEANQVRAFLGDDYSRLGSYVQNLRKGAARGRTVDDILTDETQRSDFIREVEEWSATYQPPKFTKDNKILVKLRAFLNAKLP